ncbi:MAG TPA: DUF4833 domain-containing protein [Anaeromyxobacteraceae bacterium]|nr:DUF4833 domain-containing protein [Anaeromyxobacteraceae bacterium]
METPLLLLVALALPAPPAAPPAPEPLASPAASHGAPTGLAGAGAPPAPGGPGERPPAEPCRPELFRIGRSTNANEVVYAARLAKEGGLDKDDPLLAEWHMLAEDGHREGLNFLENLIAYGFSVDPAPGGEGYTVVLKAKKDRPIHLTLRDGCPAALVSIGGREGLLRRIFVQAGSGGVIPTVAWADIDGVDPKSGASLHERVFPSASSPAAPPRRK